MRPKLAPGAVAIADDVTCGPIGFETLLAHVENDEPLPDADDDPQTAGIGRCVTSVREADGVDSFLLPVGSGSFVSRVE